MKKNKKSRGRQQNQLFCSICKKTTVSSYNRPNSLHKTKRKVYANLQLVNSEMICTGCLKTKSKLLNK